MENELYTITLCRSDWDLVMSALRALSAQRIREAGDIGLDSTYGAVLLNEAGIMQSLASDIDFILPE